MAILKNPQVQSLPWGGGPEAYHRAVQGESHPLCLYSGIGGRFSYVGFDPIVKVRIFPDRLEVSWGEKTEIFQDNPFLWMPSSPNMASLPPSPSFASGWVGFFGYEMAPFADAGLPKRDLPSDFLLGAWGLYDPILVFDHAEEKAWLASWGITEDMRADDKLAKERIKDVMLNGALQGAVKNPPPARGVAQDDKNLKSNFTRAEYESAVHRILDYIRSGDCYQVNLSQKFCFEWRREWDIASFFWEKAKAHPAPYAACLDFEGLQILSFSPEVLLRREGNQIETRPIKGTRRRSLSLSEDQRAIEELTSSAKDASELLMIVDLERNDLGKICRPGSVEVPRLKEVESFDYVHHLVATVRGELPEGRSTMQALLALFPGGSITGAPKRRAMEIIRELEDEPRGVYTGAIGFWDYSSQGLFNIAIRTLEIRKGVASFGVGGGIVAESDPTAEYEETLTKAKVFLE